MKKLLSGLCVMALLVTVAGCGGGPSAESQIAKINDNNMKKMLAMYKVYQSFNRFEGPKDEASFKQFLKSDERAAKRLGNLSIDVAEVDNLFVSDRDGQPYVIRWGLKGSPVGGDDPVVFEKDGVSGTWQVGFSSHKIRETSDEKEYKAWMDGKFEPENGGIPERNETRESGPSNFD